MTDIREFIAARLDEDEQIARHAIHLREGPEQWQVGSVTYREDYAFVSIHTPDGLEIAGAGFDGTGGIHGEVFATHIARHDPARVLADVAAKRKLLAEIDAITIRVADGFPDDQAHERPAGRMLRALAMAYAEHPDFQPEWRIDA